MTSVSSVDNLYTTVVLKVGYMSGPSQCQNSIITFTCILIQFIRPPLRILHLQDLKLCLWIVTHMWVHMQTRSREI